MHSNQLARKPSPVFRRSRLVLKSNSGPSNSTSKTPVVPQKPPAKNLEDCNVLVVNASNDMAREITSELTTQIPGCSLMYAPSLELAKWVLKRRKIDLVVSSAMLPDGSISRLRPILSSLEQPPDVVVVGDINIKSAQMFGDSGYEFAVMKRFQGASRRPEPGTQVLETSETISALGADIRNDLNNPLQEIVAMVFVAQAEGELSPSTNQALAAIDSAAQNMAKVVKGLEDKIREVVG